MYIACGYTDLRRGIDGLASIVEQQFHLDAFSNTLFLLCGRKRDRLKGLYWEGDGFLLVYKRLENGSFQWPRTGEEARELSAQQYRWLMEGLRTCIHNRWTPSERVFFRPTASIFLAGRQPACEKSPCLTKKFLTHPASPGYEYRF